VGFFSWHFIYNIRFRVYKANRFFFLALPLYFPAPCTAALPALVHHTHYFMHKQPHPCRHLRRILPRSKYLTSPDRKDSRIQCLRQFCSSYIRMDAHHAEVVTKTRLEKGAYRFRKSLTSSSQVLDTSLQILKLLPDPG
jgi:hypothetical protein